QTLDRAGSRSTGRVLGGVSTYSRGRVPPLPWEVPLDYRLVASPRATALRSIFAYLALVPLLALLGCAGKGGTTASGGSGGSNGSKGTGGAIGSGRRAPA